MTGSLVMRCGAYELALLLSTVREVVRMAAMAAPALPSIPHSLGLVNLRGKQVPVIDLGARLKLRPQRTVAELVDGHIVFLREEAARAAFAIDEVREVNEAELLPPDVSLLTKDLTPIAHALAGMLEAEGRNIPVFDPGRLIDDAEKKNLAEVSSSIA